MVRRRALLRSGAVGALGGLAGCGGLPIVGCSPPDVEPPEATFSLRLTEDRGDGQFRYDVVNEGPATFDGDNTSRLRVHTYEGGNLRSITSWFDADARVPAGSDPEHVGGATPVEAGDTGVLFQDVDRGWHTVRVEWAPPGVAPDAPRCRLRVLREWPEPPADDPHF